MTTATVQEVQTQLPELIAGLRPGEELVIVEQDRPIARLVAEPARKEGRTRKLGGGKGKLIIIKEDAEHLDDFQEYMQ